MVTALFLSIIVGLLSVIFSIFPEIGTIPFVDTYLVTGFGYFNAMVAEFPPLAPVWQCFLWYTYFRLTMMFIKFFFGHRIDL